MPPLSIFIFCVCTLCLHARRYITWRPEVAVGAPELEFWLCATIWNQTRSSVRVRALDHWAIPADLIYFPRGKWHAHLLFRLGSAKLIIYLKKVLSQLPHRILAPETIPFERKVLVGDGCACVCVCTCVEIRGQFSHSGVPDETQVCQAWRQASLSTEPSSWPLLSYWITFSFYILQQHVIFSSCEDTLSSAVF